MRFPELLLIRLRRFLKIFMVSPAQPAAAMAAFARMAKGQVRNYSAPLDMAIPASKQKYIPSSGSYPKGFLVSGTHVGVKASNTKFPDLALISSETPCSAAAVFTTNKFQAAPVQVSKKTLESRQGQGIRSVVINSGCANAVTGKGGLEDAVNMGKKVDECNGLSEPSTIVMSTGVIGQRYIPLPLPQPPPRRPHTHTHTHTQSYESLTSHDLPDFLSPRSSTKSPRHTRTSHPRTTPGSPPPAPSVQQTPFPSCSREPSPSPRPPAAPTASPA